MTLTTPRVGRRNHPYLKLNGHSDKDMEVHICRQTTRKIIQKTKTLSTDIHTFLKLHHKMQDILGYPMSNQSTVFDFDEILCVGLWSCVLVYDYIGLCVAPIFRSIWSSGRELWHLEGRQVSRSGQSLMTSISGPEGQIDLKIGSRSVRYSYFPL